MSKPSDNTDSNKHRFVRYAGADLTRWKELIGQKINHSLFGSGEIIDLQASPIHRAYSLYIRFSHDVLHFVISLFGRDSHILFLTLSLDTLANIKTEEMREDLQLKLGADKPEERRIAAEQEQAQIAARKAEEQQIAAQRAGEKQKIQRLCNAINSHQTPEGRALLIAELTKFIEQVVIVPWAIIPDIILQELEIWALYPRELRLDLLFRMISNNRSSIEGFDTFVELCKLLQMMDVREQKRTISCLPEWAKRQAPVLQFFSLEEQVGLIFPFLVSGYEHDWQPEWCKLSWQGKLLCIYRAAKEHTYILPLGTIREEINPIVKVALILLWARYNPDKAELAFQRANTLLEEFVIENAWSSTEILDLHPLLPGCESKVVNYCEGRLGHRDENETSESDRVSHAYCPRRKSPCSLFAPKDYPNVIVSSNRFPLSGARLYAECVQHWRKWSLLELLAMARITPHLPGLQHPDEYVTKFSGWVNRLNEIRPRLKCSRCGTIMRSERKYALFLARFNATVFSCPSPGHDKVYINFCWGCEKIIDSRESKIKTEKFYLCIHCGSGPQTSETYTQGDICPKCGTLDMKKTTGNDRIRKCSNCGHSIKIPDNSKRTGQGSMRPGSPEH